MQVLSINNAHCTWFLPMGDLNPTGKSLFPSLMNWLRDRYHFAKMPASPLDVEKDNSLHFKAGVFQGTRAAVDVDLNIYGDGMIGRTTSSTADTDEFLEDVLRGAQADLGLFYSPDMVRDRWYSSELIIRLDHPIASLNPRLAAFTEKINACARNYKASVTMSDFETGGLSFLRDTSTSVFKGGNFSIERRTDAPFSENRFYSKAPFQTADHVTLLIEFEEVLRHSGK